MNYTATAAKAAAMLRKAGCAMTLRVTTPGTYDPETGMESGAVAVDHACVGILQAPQSKGFGNTWLDGTQIQAGDVQALLAASGLAVTPKAGDSLTVGADIYTVVTVQTTQPGGVALLHKLVGRK